MNMNPLVAMFGTLAGAGGIAGLYFGLGVDWLPLAIVAGVIVLGYILARLTAQTRFGDFMRGCLIGINAGLNGFLGVTLYSALLGPAGWVLGITLGVLDFLTVFPAVSRSEVFQGVLGWMCVLMPMSYLVAGIGLLFFLVNLILHPIGLAAKVQKLRIRAMRVDWKTGTFFQRGGWISNLNPIDTAFNMGNFSFVDEASGAWHLDHEAGHTLNLAAFGSVFHLIGAVDENVTGGGANAFSERIAESNNPSTTQGNIIPMWT